MSKRSFEKLGISVMIALLFLAGWHSRAAASEASYPEGLYIGADLIMNIPEGDLRGDFVKVDPGGGLDFKIGYIFPIRLALEAELGFTGHKVGDEQASIGFVAVDLRYLPFVLTLPSDLQLFPYIRAGVGSYALFIKDFPDGSGRRDDFELTGKGFDVGVGFDLYVLRNLSVGGGLMQRFIKYDDLHYLQLQLAKDVKGPMTTVNFGVQYHF